MKNLFLILFILACSGTGFAQNFGEIQGKIFDEKGEVMPYVYVAVKQGETVIDGQTDFDGKFKIKPLLEGHYTLTASFVGYNSFVMKDIVVTGDKITRLMKLSMKVATEEIPTADVFGYRIPLIDPEETTLRTITMSDFQHSPSSKSITGIITAVTADVKTNSDGEIMFRGSRPGAGVFYIDGVKIKSSSLPSIPSSGISSVKVYSGGIPAKYGDTTGGVVVIETKNSLTEYYKRQARANN